MREERLLERISRWDAGGDERRNLASVDVLTASVMAHLQRILNTRQGSAQIDGRFGIPDFTNIASVFTQSLAGEIGAELTEIIGQYEPRLKSPRLEMMPDRTDAMSLSFELSGVLQVDENAVPVRLATRIGSQGRVSVSR